MFKPVIMSVYGQYPRLMEDLREGKQEAFKVVFDKLNNLLICHARSRLRNNESAIEDIVAECWLKVFRYRAKFKCIEHVEATAVTIIKQLCIDRWIEASQYDKWANEHMSTFREEKEYLPPPPQKKKHNVLKIRKLLRRTNTQSPYTI